MSTKNDIGALKEKLWAFSKEELIAELVGALYRGADMARALQPFADFATGSKHMPDDFVITTGSGFARRQLTMGDCRRASAVFATVRGSDNG